MTPSRQQLILSLVKLTSDLVDAASRDESGRFIRTLSTIEDLVSRTRRESLSRTVLDIDVEDDDL